jgi:hypothetical protein
MGYNTNGGIDIIESKVEVPVRKRQPSGSDGVSGTITGDSRIDVPKSNADGVEAIVQQQMITG